MELAPRVETFQEALGDVAVFTQAKEIPNKTQGFFVGVNMEGGDNNNKNNDGENFGKVMFCSTKNMVKLPLLHVFCMISWFV